MYDHQNIEKKWQDKWSKENLYRVGEDKNKPKYYILDMFPYPSGVGLHVGHPKGYIATDILARAKILQGFNVLHPMGFDAFGLPAENYAISKKMHPRIATEENVANYKRQLGMFGFSYDWDREINTTDPEYYKWTQWMFAKMFEKSLVYESNEPINWCPSCKTGLSNEDLEDGKCERCGTPIELKPLRQWVIRITDYAERLLTDLDKLPHWENSIKEMQRNWIGKSEGAEVDFSITDSELKIKVFTTRVDTIFGCTYVVLAPENSLLDELKDKITNWSDVVAYRETVKNKSTLERTDLNKDKSGVELVGIKAINPFTGEEVKIFAADYVLNNYGTGAVMAVPAHDDRDFEFAKKYNLEIRTSISPENNSEDEPYCDDGLLVNSGEFTGLKSAEARTRMIDFLTRTEQGEKTINYRLRDWLVSRQRYWGAPIPIIYCDHCGEVPVPVEDLPVKLPTDVDFRPTGESPLKYSTEFHNVTCPKCGAKARRESDTMDTFVCSSWYYLRYADSKNTEVFAAADKLAKWLPVDLYFGGAEHTVLHLLYARFFTKVLKKYGYVNFNEPFLKLRHQGIILGEDGNKMSKSKGNVINPDDLVQSHGADSLRLYEMFMGPLEDMKPWNSKGIIGVSRFLDRVSEINQDLPRTYDKKIVSLLHKTIKKVGDDIEEFKYNTAISALMILVNEIYDFKNKNNSWPLSKDNLALFVRILEPFAPHLAEELWSQMGNKELLVKESWPKYDEALLKDDTFVLAIQINGKLRSTIEVASDITEEAVKELAFADENVKKWMEDKEVVKVVYVKGKLLSIVIK